MRGKFGALVKAAWDAYGAPEEVLAIQEISANVSTNAVYRVQLPEDRAVVAKVTSYGSYVHFRQDHRLIHQWRGLLQGTRYGSLLAGVRDQDGKPFTFRQGGHFVAFYDEMPYRSFLPPILSETQISAFGREMGAFHSKCERLCDRLYPTWKSIGSDIANLYDALGSEQWRTERAFAPEVEDDLKRQCDEFLSRAPKLGYHVMPRIPILVDWNIGNFSIEEHGDDFQLFSRWDYDWFRVEPRALDFYFFSRVVSAVGDKEDFSYFVRPMLEPRFGRFLQAYHRVYPLTDDELLFMKEAYRFFILNYVVRSGEHFFKPDICRRLQRESLSTYLPTLDAISDDEFLTTLRGYL